MPEYFTVLVFLVVGTGFAVVSLLLSRLLRRDRPDPLKLSTYECGEIPVGQAWTRFRAGYYIWPLIFIVFEIGTVFLFPTAMKLNAISEAGTAPALLALFHIILFISVLLLGLVYAWKKGALRWE